ncbi:hypothetical protein NQ176_g6134 [Zarea fungicola]|uniref:Uncharacterized protein n=1 Tax=Zarea fungicola TaxID=93591 RepID=A0ACC1N761_9HYPO|nr:hypothetical protein NQ176_g6134 [Lecanicillium fungicola]
MQASLDSFLLTPSYTSTPKTCGGRSKDFSQATPSSDNGRPTPRASQGGNKRRMQDVGDETMGSPSKKPERQLFTSKIGRNLSLENSSTNLENNSENKSKVGTALSTERSTRDVGVQTSDKPRTPLAKVKNMNRKFGEA